MSWKTLACAMLIVWVLQATGTIFVACLGPAIREGTVSDPTRITWGGKTWVVMRETGSAKMKAQREE